MKNVRNPKNSRSVITLTTDFGLTEHFVGVMKGVIVGINPDVELVDLTHMIAPQNIAEAALILASAYNYFPPATVHLVVVDPGVGSSRKPIAVEAGGHYFVGPDNGVFTRIYEENPGFKAYVIEEAEYMLPNVSSTFHGRDIFAPAAAHLSLGISLGLAPGELGGELGTEERLNLPKPAVEGEVIHGNVMRVDKFGNLITNIDAVLLTTAGFKEFVIKVGGRRIKGLVNSYSDVPDGGLLAVIGSDGFIEVVVNCGRADEECGVDIQAGSFPEVVIEGVE